MDTFLINLLYLRDEKQIEQRGALTDATEILFPWEDSKSLLYNLLIVLTATTGFTLAYHIVLKAAFSHMAGNWTAGKKVKGRDNHKNLQRAKGYTNYKPPPAKWTQSKGKFTSYLKNDYLCEDKKNKNNELIQTKTKNSQQILSSPRGEKKKTHAGVMNESWIPKEKFSVEMEVCATKYPTHENETHTAVMKPSNELGRDIHIDMFGEVTCLDLEQKMELKTTEKVGKDITTEKKLNSERKNNPPEISNNMHEPLPVSCQPKSKDTSQLFNKEAGHDSALKRNPTYEKDCTSVVKKEHTAGSTELKNSREEHKESEIKTKDSFPTRDLLPLEQNYLKDEIKSNRVDTLAEKEGKDEKTDRSKTSAIFSSSKLPDTDTQESKKDKLNSKSIQKKQGKNEDSKISSFNEKIPPPGISDKQESKKDKLNSKSVQKKQDKKEDSKLSSFCEKIPPPGIPDKQERKKDKFNSKCEKKKQDKNEDSKLSSFCEKIPHQFSQENKGLMGINHKPLLGSSPISESWISSLYISHSDSKIFSKSKTTNNKPDSCIIRTIKESVSDTDQGVYKKSSNFLKDYSCKEKEESVDKICTLPVTVNKKSTFLEKKDRGISSQEITKAKDIKDPNYFAIEKQNIVNKEHIKKIINNRQNQSVSKTFSNQNKVQQNEIKNPPQNHLKSDKQTQDILANRRKNLKCQNLDDRAMNKQKTIELENNTKRYSKLKLFGSDKKKIIKQNELGLKVLDFNSIKQPASRKDPPKKSQIPVLKSLRYRQNYPEPEDRDLDKDEKLKKSHHDIKLNDCKRNENLSITTTFSSPGTKCCQNMSPGMTVSPCDKENTIPSNSDEIRQTAKSTCTVNKDDMAWIGSSSKSCDFGFTTQVEFPMDNSTEIQENNLSENKTSMMTNQREELPNDILNNSEVTFSQSTFQIKPENCFKSFKSNGNNFSTAGKMKVKQNSPVLNSSKTTIGKKKVAGRILKPKPHLNVAFTGLQKIGERFNTKKENKRGEIRNQTLVQQTVAMPRATEEKRIRFDPKFREPTNYVTIKANGKTNGDTIIQNSPFTSVRNSEQLKDQTFNKRVQMLKGRKGEIKILEKEKGKITITKQEETPIEDRAKTKFPNRQYMVKSFLQSDQKTTMIKNYSNPNQEKILWKTEDRISTVMQNTTAEIDKKSGPFTQTNNNISAMAKTLTKNQLIADQAKLQIQYSNPAENGKDKNISNIQVANNCINGQNTNKQRRGNLTTEARKMKNGEPATKSPHTTGNQTVSTLKTEEKIPSCFSKIESIDIKDLSNLTDRIRGKEESKQNAKYTLSPKIQSDSPVVIKRMNRSFENATQNKTLGNKRSFPIALKQKMLKTNFQLKTVPCSSKTPKALEGDKKTIDEVNSQVRQQINNINVLKVAKQTGPKTKNQKPENITDGTELNTLEETTFHRKKTRLSNDQGSVVMNLTPNVTNSLCWSPTMENISNAQKTELESSNLNSILSNLACIENIDSDEARELSLPHKLPDLIVTSSGDTRSKNSSENYDKSIKKSTKKNSSFENGTEKNQCLCSLSSKCSFISKTSPPSSNTSHTTLSGLQETLQIKLKSNSASHCLMKTSTNGVEYLDDSFLKIDSSVLHCLKNPIKQLMKEHDSYSKQMIQNKTSILRSNSSPNHITNQNQIIVKKPGQAMSMTNFPTPNFQTIFSNKKKLHEWAKASIPNRHFLKNNERISTENSQESFAPDTATYLLDSPTLITNPRDFLLNKDILGMKKVNSNSLHENKMNQSKGGFISLDTTSQERDEAQSSKTCISWLSDDQKHTKSVSINNVAVTRHLNGKNYFKVEKGREMEMQSVHNVFPSNIQNFKNFSSEKSNKHTKDCHNKSSLSETDDNLNDNFLKEARIENTHNSSFEKAIKDNVGDRQYKIPVKEMKCEKLSNMFISSSRKSKYVASAISYGKKKASSTSLWNSGKTTMNTECTFHDIIGSYDNQESLTGIKFQETEDISFSQDEKFVASAFSHDKKKASSTTSLKNGNGLMNTEITCYKNDTTKSQEITFSQKDMTLFQTEMMKNNNKIPISFTSLHTSLNVDEICTHQSEVTDVTNSEIFSQKDDQSDKDKTSDDVSSAEFGSFLEESRDMVSCSTEDTILGPKNFTDQRQQKANCLVLNWYKPRSQLTMSEYGTAAESDAMNEEYNRNNIESQSNNPNRSWGTSRLESPNKIYDNSEDVSDIDEDSTSFSSSFNSQFCSDVCCISQEPNSDSTPLQTSLSAWCHPHRKLNHTLSNICPFSIAINKTKNISFKNICFLEEPDNLDTGSYSINTETYKSFDSFSACNDTNISDEKKMLNNSSTNSVTANKCYKDFNKSGSDEQNCITAFHLSYPHETEDYLQLQIAPDDNPPFHYQINPSTVTQDNESSWKSSENNHKPYGSIDIGIEHSGCDHNLHSSIEENESPFRNLEEDFHCTCLCPEFCFSDGASDCPSFGSHYAVCPYPELSVQSRGKRKADTTNNLQASKRLKQDPSS